MMLIFYLVCTNDDLRELNRIYDLDLTEKATSRTFDLLFNLIKTVASTSVFGSMRQTIDSDGLRGSNCTLSV